MFTVKLFGGHSVKLVEAEEVNIYPAGPATGIAQDPKDRTNDVREVATMRGGLSAAFYIADPSKPRPQGWAEETEFFDSAYVENSNGSTTQIVRPY